MKTAGVITEFNPFHSGHEYFLRTVRERSGADYIVAVMSGDFVQRGEPAIVSKYVRAEAALYGGCDLVLELPVRYSLSDAGGFASGAVSILMGLGCIDELWFGSECGEIGPLLRMAEILNNEPEEFKAELQSRLKAGDSYPKARAAALKTALDGDFSLLTDSPNNILGMEYCRAALKMNAPFALKTLRREGSGYQEDRLEPGFPSALAIRKALLSSPASILSTDNSLCPNPLPEKSRDLLSREPGFLRADDFSALLGVRLLEEDAGGLEACAGVSADLAKRILHNTNRLVRFEDFALDIKTRNITLSRVSRALFSILLKIPAEQSSLSVVRILAMRDCAALLKAVSEKGSLRTEASSSKIPPEVYGEDLYASSVYERVRSARFGVPFIHEHTRKLICLN